MGHQGILHGGLGLYGLAWKLALPWLKKNKRLCRGFHRRIAADHLAPAEIWIQAASAGEAYLACALVQAMVPRQPLTVLVTTTTTQGMDILKKGMAAPDIDPHVRVNLSLFPFDTPSLMDAAVSRVNPGTMVLLETELWPGLLHALKKRHIPILMINARLSNKSVSRYEKTSWLWKQLAPDTILAISPEDAQRFQRIFPHTAISTMPNIKFDMVIPQKRATSPTPVPLAGNPFPPNTPVTLLASVRMEEENQVAKILDAILCQYPNQVVGLIPRHMHRIPFWQDMLTHLERPWQLRSTINDPVLPGTTILWDTFGELKAAYGHATVAFVGGSLHPLGGQNFMEPVMCGAPAVTGPHLDNFNWVGQGLFTAGVVNRAQNSAQVVHHLVRILNHPPQRQQTATTGLGYLRRYQGGTAMAVDTIIKTLNAVKNHE
ncbi:3-deoxy-D-manno-octulosonic-acid transferase [Desulfocicer vacuolatum DSM 3385]|uniref:3-deoxy-D-manno-octulosonic acid transferase n=2 Tax=Desulfocicer vacuolatum TaxID=2298 RepID=A0A1W1Z871_9BACT|nr:3-deoxy-D-manno-octulosonic-acid transferase [Desulfocicer vacuolatum DSM 3385]